MTAPEAPARSPTATIAPPRKKRGLSVDMRHDRERLADLDHEDSFVRVPLEVILDPNLTGPPRVEPYVAIGWRLDARRDDDLETTASREKCFQRLPECQRLAQRLLRVALRSGPEHIEDMNVVHESLEPRPIWELLARRHGLTDLGRQEPATILAR